MIARNGGVKGCKDAVEPLRVGEGRGETFGVVPKRIFELGAVDLGTGELAPFARVADALESSRGGGNVTVASIVNVAGFAAVLFVLWIFIRRCFRVSRATTRKVDFLLGGGLKL